jgi:tRNA modification GTPase
MSHHDETIAAIASAPGAGARGIVRISGPAAIDCVRPWFTAAVAAGSTGARNPFPETVPTAISGELRLAEFHSAIPAEVYVWPTDRSYTRRPSVELHVPASAPITAAVLAEVCRRGARPARPGEFTLQAFLAGRIDLTQAEAVLGVVDAADMRGLASALKQMAGGLAEPLRLLRSDLLNLIADLEAGLDFVEEDIEFIDRAALVARLESGRAVVAELLARMAARGEAVELPRVVLVGLPNVGKSTLFNALAGAERALVSPVAGTTRDYLTCRLTLAGIEFELIDTAGFDDSTADETTEHAIAAASQQAMTTQRRAADLVVHCVDAVTSAELVGADPVSDAQVPVLTVYTKSDLRQVNALTSDVESEDRLIRVSAATGVGLDRLRQAISQELIAAQAARGDVVGATAVRCRDSLRRAEDALAEATGVARSRRGDELVAAELRAAIDELGRVAGVVYTDDILDRIFSRFCIGK